MTRATILLLSVFLAKVATAQPSAAVPSDTLYVKNNAGGSKGCRHMLYIDRNRNAPTRAEVTNFSFNEDDAEAYYRYQKDYAAQYKKLPPHNLPANWLPLREYKGKFYISKPCSGPGDELRINGNEVITRTMDGPEPMPIQKVERTADGNYTIHFAERNYEDVHGVHYGTLTITKPKNKGIPEGVMNFKFSGERFEKDNTGILYVPAEKAYLFDMIVCDCPCYRVNDFDLDNLKNPFDSR